MNITPSKIKAVNESHSISQAVVAHAFNPSTLGGRGRWISEFKASLVYRVTSRTSRATQRNPVSKKPTPPKVTLFALLLNSIP